MNFLNNILVRILIALSCLLPLHALGDVTIPAINWNPGSDWLNVREHGVVGDGETDDTVALQRILTDMGDGQVVYFPPGTYRITQGLEIGRKNSEGVPTGARVRGVSFYGHGSKSVLKYEGAPGAVMLRIRGMVHYRMAGLVFDGSGLARVGMHHDNRVDGMRLFETHLYHSFIQMSHFTEYGILFGTLDGEPAGESAETVFRHMIFEDCGTGIGFTNFNDYNFTFDGNIFCDNARMAIECVYGNFYVRNCRFENNGLDVFCNPEHSSSIRRSVSVGSGSFLESVNPISPLTVENCLIVDWRKPYAIVSKGAPMLVFDNTFKSSSNKPAAIDASAEQNLVLAANAIDGPLALLSRVSSSFIQADISSTSPLAVSEDDAFMPTQVFVPGRHFDVKEDFGAVGDGKADDTDAIQNAIDAARAYGNHAMAYLPKGEYRITRTLHVDGGEYMLGGSGFLSVIVFDGDPDMDALVVSPNGQLFFDAFSVKRLAATTREEYRDYREGKPVRVSDFKGRGADIRQIASKDGSMVVYHTVYVQGKYVEMPFQLGLRLEGLAKHDTVLLHNIEGNLQVFDSGEATVLHSVGYEGTLWVKGGARGGFLGILTRLSTLSRHSIYVEDSQSLVASDFYVEQAPPESVVLMGKPEDGPGRATITLVKTTRNLHVQNYQGDVNVVSSQFYGPPKVMGLEVDGTDSWVNFISSYFYLKGFFIEPDKALVGWLGNAWLKNCSMPIITDDHSKIEGAIKDLRKLGYYDWTINYPHLLNNQSLY